MARNTRAFIIEDQLSTSDNLDAYAQVLDGMDPALAAALRPYLASMAAGQPVDTSAIWSALHAATASADLDHANGTPGGGT